jgi:hypothetical protein
MRMHVRIQPQVIDAIHGMRYTGFHARTNAVRPKQRPLLKKNGLLLERLSRVSVSVTAWAADARAHAM